MSGLFILMAVIVALLVLDALAQAFGVDSRPEFDDPRSPAREITV